LNLIISKENAKAPFIAGLFVLKSFLVKLEEII